MTTKRKKKPNEKEDSKLINLDKQYTCVSLCTGCDYTLFLMKNKKDGKVYLFSSGNAEKGRTGQGKDNKNTFKLIDSNSIRNVEFKSISANKYSSAAISTEGKLFVWGGNSSGQLGIGNTSDVYEPQLCSFFEKDYEVEDIQLIATKLDSGSATMLFTAIAGDRVYSVELSDKGWSELHQHTVVLKPKKNTKTE